MLKKFDSITAKKLLTEENNVLKSELDDLKTTLKINKELLYKYVNEGKKSENTLLTQVNEENSRLSKKIEELFEEKKNFEKKIYKIQQSFEDRMSFDREIIDKNNEKVFIFENKILEKNVKIDQLNSELHLYLTTQNLKKFRHIFVTEPNKTNIDLNNELNYTRDILEKISRLMNSEKIRSENMQSQIKVLQEEINLFKKNNKAYPSITKNIILDSFENFEVLSSEEIILSVEDTDTNLVSPPVKFPDKLQMSLSINSNLSGKSIPKLDFTKVRAKYKSTMLKVENKDIKVIADKNSDYNSANKILIVEKETDLKKQSNIDNKIKSEMLLTRKINEKLKLKVDKYKKLYHETKTTLIGYSNSLKIANIKIEMLETQVKKLFTSVPTTEDTLKRDRNNTSMNANTTVREEFINQQLEAVENITNNIKLKD